MWHELYAHFESHILHHRDYFSGLQQRRHDPRQLDKTNWNKFWTLQYCSDSFNNSRIKSAQTDVLHIQTQMKLTEFLVKNKYWNTLIPLSPVADIFGAGRRSEKMPWVSKLKNWAPWAEYGADALGIQFSKPRPP